MDEAFEEAARQQNPFTLVWPDHLRRTTLLQHTEGEEIITTGCWAMIEGPIPAPSAQNHTRIPT